MRQPAKPSSEPSQFRIGARQQSCGHLDGTPAPCRSIRRRLFGGATEDTPPGRRRLYLYTPRKAHTRNPLAQDFI